MLSRADKELIRSLMKTEAPDEENNVNGAPAGARIMSAVYPHDAPIYTSINESSICRAPIVAIQRDKINNESAYLINGFLMPENGLQMLNAQFVFESALHDMNLQNLVVAEQNPLPGESLDVANPSPRSFDSGIEPDCTDGNLSWLLNYKIPDLPPFPDASAEPAVVASDVVEPKPSTSQASSQEVAAAERSTNQQSENENYAANNSYRYSGPTKPPFTYTELIEHALYENTELTVSGIYQWISEHFSFYKQNDDRWKNSVRHNLSINPHFRKGGKAVHGAGHLWTINLRDEIKARNLKQRMNQYLQTTYKDMKSKEQEDFDRELQMATESILQEISHQAKEESDNIEVEFVNVEGAVGLEDFLTPPVSKQEIVNECGLGSDFFITDINPNTLCLNFHETEMVPGEEKIYSEVLEYYE